MPFYCKYEDEEEKKKRVRQKINECSDANSVNLVDRAKFSLTLTFKLIFFSLKIA